MKSVILLGACSLAINLGFGSIAKPAFAQLDRSQTFFSKCVLSLYSGSYTSSQAAEQCLDRFFFAQTTITESYSRCVLNLYDGPYTSTKSADYCLQAFQNNRVSSPERFSRCVLNLYDGPYTSTKSADYCLQAFQGQQSNESLQACVSALYSGPYTSRLSEDYCTRVLSGASASKSSPSRVFRISNNTQAEVKSIYLAPAGSSGWGPNDLKGSTIYPGQSVDFTLGSPSCSYDLWIALSNGRVIDERQINTCEYTGYTLR